MHTSNVQYPFARSRQRPCSRLGAPTVVAAAGGCGDGGGCCDGGSCCDGSGNGGGDGGDGGGAPSAASFAPPSLAAASLGMEPGEHDPSFNGFYCG